MDDTEVSRLAGPKLPGRGTVAVTFDVAPAVPLPGALPLFTSAFGLGGFFGYMRKRKAAMA
jgi:hypothetical protein